MSVEEEKDQRLWTFSPVFCWASGGQFNTGYQYAMILPGLHLYVHVTHTHTHKPNTQAVAPVMMMHWLFDGVCVCVWCVSRFVQRAVLSERPSAAMLVLSLHHEHMTVLWLSGLQLLRDNDCNGIASRGQQRQKLKGDSSTKTGSHALLKPRPLRNGGLSSCSPLLGRQICLIMHQDVKLRQKKRHLRGKRSWGVAFGAKWETINSFVWMKVTLPPALVSLFSQAV